ncbi:hypothetical protein O6H91_04G127300 [Diphasiastrum complanatum]|uniref:Uncharacterized protein n=1 Tax=Diphasiastrum complanatum TaxID=34168 RepID=A0ACC2E1S0_DIPCM|nr:hypothetical protein O6H91_04G127300 [Diphasiastrum complanatum]
MLTIDLAIAGLADVRGRRKPVVRKAAVNGRGQPAPFSPSDAQKSAGYNDPGQKITGSSCIRQPQPQQQQHQHVDERSTELKGLCSNGLHCDLCPPEPLDEIKCFFAQQL